MIQFVTHSENPSADLRLCDSLIVVVLSYPKKQIAIPLCHYIISFAYVFVKNAQFIFPYLSKKTLKNLAFCSIYTGKHDY